ncbi:sensor histidine kinase [Glycomyces algeriensis]|uniref:histidine kinase n=1 Tax=Glycomyces algeriensis TaxID=256037 RepID=A0A9W6G8R4_9ACTN|nr:histidine kinase [Glycomyces algeriensis]MDA1365073.1 histidine kinase [Glycomyces algeriensis]MDR7349865.1 signal transduction histidine kinase [Glycomyces algeriensis]GLI42576.1 two-component sensor histidine kinase [Glycomyces algeriensis]
MTRLGLPERFPQWAWDTAIMGVAIAHLAFVIDLSNQPVATLACVGVLALVLRRRWPFAVFLVTLPAAFLVFEKVASMIALYTIARESRRPWLPLTATALLAFCFIFQGSQVFYLFLGPGRVTPFTAAIEVLPQFISPYESYLRSALFYTAMAAVPAILGYSQRARQSMADRFAEIQEAREHEQLLLTQQALAAERAQLAREMHDVVSHQVSLIAVQAGALQVLSTDEEGRRIASTIRRLSVTTLEELRHMVQVLRVSGSRATELTPQPTLEELGALVAGSGIEVELHVERIIGLDPAGQRAVYRTVQEALTNARKHAPGAAVAVSVVSSGDGAEVSVVNAPGARPVLELPGSRHGLLGLRQRAELLGGRFEAGPTPEGGWAVRVWVPRIAAAR